MAQKHIKKLAAAEALPNGLNKFLHLTTHFPFESHLFLPPTPALTQSIEFFGQVAVFGGCYCIVSSDAF